MYVSCGGPLTRSGSLVNKKSMSLNIVINSAISTKCISGFK